jgi:hypothetical protein
VTLVPLFTIPKPLLPEIEPPEYELDTNTTLFMPYIKSPCAAGYNSETLTSLKEVRGLVIVLSVFGILNGSGIP